MLMTTRGYRYFGDLTVYAGVAKRRGAYSVTRFPMRRGLILTGRPTRWYRARWYRGCWWGLAARQARQRGWDWEREGR